MRKGLHFLRAELPIILATRSDVPSPRMLRAIEELARRLAPAGGKRTPFIPSQC